MGSKRTLLAIYTAKEKMRVVTKPAKFRVLEKLCGTINTCLSVATLVVTIQAEQSAEFLKRVGRGTMPT